MAWYAHSLARGLMASGHEVIMFAQRGSPLAEWAIADEVPCNSDFDFHTKNPFELLSAVSMLRRTIQSLKPDVLNPHCPPGHLLLAIANRKGQLPLVRTVAEPRCPKQNWFNRRLHERKTNAIVYSTKSSQARYLDVFDLTQVQQTVILPGIDIQRFPEVPTDDWKQKLGVKSDQILAAIIARMSPEKGQELLIEALALLEESERACFVIVMSGDDSRERSAHHLRELAAARGVEGVLRFVPRVSDVRRLITDIDLGIITSVRSEAVCRIALEFMAYGKPVISTDVNILPEVIREENGWVVNSRNAAELAEVLKSVIRNREELQTRGSRGYDLLKSQFTLERQVNQTVSFFEKVVKTHG